jgi:hypothetical protein
VKRIAAFSLLLVVALVFAKPRGTVDDVLDSILRKERRAKPALAPAMKTVHADELNGAPSFAAALAFGFVLSLALTLALAGLIAENLVPPRMPRRVRLRFSLRPV